MIDVVFWATAAEQWIYIDTEKDKQERQQAMDILCQEAEAKRQEERSIVDELLAAIDEEDDDD
jgi:hypothetical protein